MATKEISGFLSVIPDRAAKKPNDPVQTEVQTGNVFFKNVTRRRTIQFWDTNLTSSSPQMKFMPWKMASLMLDDDDTVGHSFIGVAARYSTYPQDPPSQAIDLLDYRKFRATKTTTTISSAAPSFVFGAVGSHDNLAASTQWLSANGIISLNDVPLEYTQIGIVYQHPMVAGGADINTTAGASYITFVNGNYLDNVFMEAHVHNVLRIVNGADAGLYFVRYVDFQNNRLYLMNLDGTLFVGQATASNLSWYTGHGRRAYFNEVSVIQLSTGLVVTGGTFRPEAARNSFILRVVFDKTGSDATAAGTERQGSYYVTLKPYTHGEGLTGPASSGMDIGRPGDNVLHLAGPGSSIFPFGFNYWDGGVNGFALDEPNQRVWFAYTNNSNLSGIAYWRWKTGEGLREIQNWAGTGAQKNFVNPALVLAASDAILDMKIGTAGIVYVGINHATAGNGGIAIIKPDLTTLQYNTGSGVPGSKVAGLAVDDSRARTGTAADTSTNGSDQITSASGAFTTSDLGRVIKLTGLGADNGTFKIATRVSATQVTVQTLGGGAVTFTSQSGGTFQIGERLYMFFTDATSGAAKINYMESLALGTFLTRAVTMTNGANCNTLTRYGENAKVAIDPATGNVYWLSNDTQQQINKYEVSTNTHTFRTVADVQSPAGGAGSITALTVFTAILVNTKFDEIWVGTDQGSVKLVKSDFAGANYKRYFGDDTTTYANPAGFFRPSGYVTGIGAQNRVRNFYLHPDGRVQVSLSDTGSARDYLAYYSREADVWSAKEDWVNSGVYVGNSVYDSIGNFLNVNPANGSGQTMIGFGAVEVQYQWDNANSKWIPLEVYQGALPNKSAADTISPGCRTKPLHAGLEEVLYGVKLGFTKQGGATPANNEFLGRAGQTTTTMTDGATSIGTATFNGSGFVSGDAGRLLRVESGADAGVYKITVFNSSTSITLALLNGTAFSAAATAATLNYTIWSLGTPGSNAGPENATVMLADGFGKDNTQDISGVTYDTFHFKTLLQENVEPTKFCVPTPLGAPGGLEMKVYYDFFPRINSPQVACHDLQTTQIRALPASEWTSGGVNGRKLVDFFVDSALDNVGSHGYMVSSPSDVNIWYGVNPVSGALGACPMVDLGADAEVGFVIVRGHCLSTCSLLYTTSVHGLKATLYKAGNAGGAPVASASSRTSGTTNLDLTLNVTTISVSSGDFLGAITTGSFSNGSATAGQSVFNAPSSTFVQGDVGKILKITSVGDVGAYRIVAVDGTGAIATIRNLDQTAKQWAASVSSIVYEVRDGVREEDVLCVPSIGAPSQRLCIERLLSATSAQVRVAPHTTIAAQSWECAIPTWDKVKRISYSTEALPPEVHGNGTYVTHDGREQYDFQDFKIYADLTDLTTAQRTGRWWQLQMMPRFVGNQTSGDFLFSSFEFYTPSGARLGTGRYTFSDTANDNADFLSQHINRLDFVQSSSVAASNWSTANGNATLSGSDANTVQLTVGGNVFLGFQTRRSRSDGVSTAGAGGNFSSATAAFITSDVGRTLNIQNGADTGYYRISVVSSATAVVVTTPSGGPVTFVGDTGKTFSLHEGIAAGGAFPDRFVLTDDLTREYTIATINNALTTITLVETSVPAFANKPWEIRRPAFDRSSTSIDSSQPARLVRAASTYPLQQGDVAHDSRGALRFWVDDIGTGNSRSDGAVAGGNGVFTGTGFCADDVGRLLYITTGVTANKGIWRISVVTNATTITVVNAYTGAAVTFAADAAADKVYKIFGDRRFKITKQVTTLRA